MQYCCTAGSRTAVCTAPYRALGYGKMAAAGSAVGAPAAGAVCCCCPRRCRFSPHPLYCTSTGVEPDGRHRPVSGWEGAAAYAVGERWPAGTWHFEEWTLLCMDGVCAEGEGRRPSPCTIRLLRQLLVLLKRGERRPLPFRSRLADRTAGCWLLKVGVADLQMPFACGVASCMYAHA